MDSCRAQFLALAKLPAPLVVVWAGGRARPAYRPDEFLAFTQCPHFQYLFGEQPANRIGALRLTSRGVASWCVFGKECTDAQRHFEDCQDAEKNIGELRAWCAGYPVLYPDSVFDAAQHAVGLAEEALRGVEHVRDGAHHKIPKMLHLARTLKTPDEIARLRVACRVTAESIARLQTLDLVGMRESQLKALFQYYCSETEGCHAMAFPPIAAGGGNTAILHYEDGDRVFQAGDLVLCDMGCRFQGYSADVTRTWFVGGDAPSRATSPWHCIHARVQEVFADMVKHLKPGITWDQLTARVHAQFLRVLRAAKMIVVEPPQEGLSLSTAQDEVVQIFFPHAIGHHLGIETHDRCGASQEAFSPGMVVALEIGIYVGDVAMHKAASHPRINEEQLRIMGRGGVRVEDNFVITETGSECLTRGLHTAARP